MRNVIKYYFSLVPILMRKDLRQCVVNTCVLLKNGAYYVEQIRFKNSYW